MTFLQPHLDHILQHLQCLLDWTSPEDQLELRCFDRYGHRPTRKAFGCAELDAAAEWAGAINQAGYNTYVVCNPLRPNLTGYATDEDVAAARLQFIDIDGVDDADRFLAEHCSAFPPSFVVQTGTTPRPRLHTYWRMDSPVDLPIWRRTQQALAHAFGSDPTVINPSRVVRLGGTVSYPSPRKQRRGYVEELTALVLANTHAVDQAAFQAAYAWSAPTSPASSIAPPALTQAAAAAGSDAVPLAIVEQALNTVPPIQETGRRRDWLALALAVKAANPAAEAVFNRWQRQSACYESTDETVWATLDPAPGSYAKLFREAAAYDADWWRAGDPATAAWWRDHVVQVFGTEAREPGQGSSTIPSVTTLEPLEISGIDLARLPPRRWIYYELLVRGYVTALAGPGGTGKTSIAMAVAISIAGGRDLLRGQNEEDRVRRQGAVLYWNLEDPLDELKLRVAAELKQRGLRQASLRDQFYLMSGRDHPLCVAHHTAQGLPQPTDLSAIVQMVRERRIVLVVIDPMVNAHALEGNSNSDLAIVIDQFRRIAHEADCAVLIVHHFRKGGQSGDVEAALGAVTLTNSCRVVETLTPMSETDAQALGIEASHRRRYVRRDNAKMNLAAAPTQCEWYGFDSVSLGNGTEEYPEGDAIGVLSRWQPVPPMQGISWDQITIVLDAINIGLENGTEFYTNSAVAKERWAGNLLMEAMGLTREQAKLVLKQWLDDGVLLVAGYKSPALGGKDAKRLVVDPHARARLRQECAARSSEDV